MTSNTPFSDSLSGSKKSTFRIGSRLFWTTFSVNALFDALLAIGVLGFGIATGYEGRPVFNTSRLGEAVEYLFGDTTQFLAFIGILAIVGFALRGALRLVEKGNRTGVGVIIVAVFVIGGVTFKYLEIGTNLVPLLVFVAFVATQTGITVLLATRRGANHQKGGA